MTTTTSETAPQVTGQSTMFMGPLVLLALALALALAMAMGSCHAARAGSGGGGAVAEHPAPLPPAVAAGPTVELRLLANQPRYRLKGDEGRIEGTLRAIEAKAAPDDSPGSPRDATGKKKRHHDEVPRTDPYPEPPRVDLTLRLTNRSNASVELWSGGDPVRVMLRLQGPGAVTVNPRIFHTMEMRPPTVATLGPGKTLDLPIPRLEYGERGDGERAYWTRPGDYSIVPSFETALRPPPPGGRADADGFAQVTLVGPALAVHVDGP